MNLKQKSIALREMILEMVYHSKTGHIGGDFSVCDILNVLYNHQMDVTPDNFNTPYHDRFILSKGHAVEALYCVLADKGFFPTEDLKHFSHFQSLMIGHPTNKIHGIEMNTGSLGHGLSVGVGMALAQRMDELPHRVYVVMGDGELAEGSVWEGAMAAGHYRLDNLVAVVDRNKLQISGGTEEVMKQGDLAARWGSFGWRALQVEGNNVASLCSVFEQTSQRTGRPTVVIADTTKGSGVSFMENKAAWHHRIPDEGEYRLALQELKEKGAVSA